MATANRDSMGLHEALSRINGPKQAEVEAVGREAARKVKAREVESQRILGDTKEWGSEPSVRRRWKVRSFGDAIRIAAEVGKRFDQDAAIAWFPDETGPDVKYTISLGDMSLDDAAAALDKAGIDFRSFEDRRVTIYDSGGELLPKSGTFPGGV